MLESLPRDDPRQRRPDIALARELLDGTPRIPIFEGLTASIEHVRRTLEEMRHDPSQPPASAPAARAVRAPAEIPPGPARPPAPLAAARPPVGARR